MKVGIDPGHGGKDPGTIGPGGTREKDITLIIGRKVAWWLKHLGAVPVLTRQVDKTLSLATRVDMLNHAACDIAVSVHINGSPNQAANYTSVWVQGLGGQAERLAGQINEQFKLLPWPCGGVRVDNFYFNRHSTGPSCVVECGFMTNPAQERELQQDQVQDRMARCIVRGLVLYRLGQ